MSRIKRCFGRVIYAFASHMPPSYSVLNIGQKKLRGFCGKLILKSCGKNVNIEKNAQFDSSLSLGDNSGLGINCRIGAGVIIGDNVMMGPNVTVYTQNHETKRTDIPMCRQGVKKIGGVTIGNDCWICDGVIILPGVKIGNGVILGAGSVIRRDVPDYAVVIGNPGEIVKFRNEGSDTSDDKCNSSNIQG